MDNNVYLIVGTERSGSSLLSSILANSGANFNMPLVQEWYRGSGAYEHPEYMRLIKHIKRSIFYKQYSDRLAHREKQKAIAIAKTLFLKTNFVKYPPFSEHIAHIVKEAGFSPRLILTCRKFNDYMKSSMIKTGGSFTYHKENYLNVNQSCFVQLFIFGGCIITYEEMVDLKEQNWAKRLEELCQLDSKVLLDERKGQVKVYESVNSLPILDETVDNLYRIINTHKDNLFFPEHKKLH